MESTDAISEVSLALAGKRKRDSHEEDDLERDPRHRNQEPANGDGKSAVDLDEDVFEEPYTAEVERPPRCAYLHPSFKRAESLRAEIPQKILEILSSTKHSDAGTVHMRDTALNLQVIDYDPKMHVGVFGMTGAGKSSVINSLLDVPMLADESGAGGACTNVVTEFTGAPDNQTAPLTAQIHLHDTDTREAMLRKHLAAYRKYYVDDLSLIENDEQEVTVRRTAATTALSILRTLCCNMPQFQTESISHESMIKANKEGQPGALFQGMRASVQHLFTGLHSRNNICEVSASTVRELHKKMKKFTGPAALRSQTKCTPSPWPLVASVRIFIGRAISRAPLLERVILADLPGLSDTNKVRVDTTMRYLRDCGAILVVEEIFRAKDSARVDEHLQKVVQQGLAPILVCTKTDELGNSSSEAIMKDEADSSLLEKLKEKEDELCEVKEDLLEASQACGRAAAKDRSELRAKKERLAQRQKSLLREVVHAKILARNKSVSEVARENFERVCPASSELQVFCVSNRTYMAYRAGFKKTEEPFLSVEETSIPALRAFLYSLSAGDMFAQLERACKGPLNDLFSNVQLWTTETDIKSQEHLANIVSKPRVDCNAMIAEYCSNLKEVASDTVLEKISASEEKWTSAAVVLHSNNWYTWHHASYSAFIRHEGDHETANIARQSWNEQMLAPVRRDLGPCFEWFHDKRQRLEDSLLASLNALIDTVCVDVEAENMGLPLDGFFAAAEAKRDLITACVVKMSKKLERAIRRNKLDATVNNPSSYFATSMSKTYETCSEEVGKDSSHRKKDIMADFLKSSKPFQAIYDGLARDLDADIKSEAAALQTAVVKVYEAMERDFANLFYREGMRNERAQHLRSQLETFLQWARAQVDGPMKEALEEAGRVNSASLIDAQNTI